MPIVLHPNPTRTAQRCPAAIPLVIALTCTACGNRATTPALSPPAPEPKPPKPTLVTPRGDLSQVEKTTIAIFQNAAPKVVFITTLALRRDFFRLDATAIPSGTGSGFLWDKKGHVVTNLHVIKDADAAKVTIDDQTVWQAELVGYHAAKDIAVLRIDAPKEKLSSLPVGTSNDLVVGQHVFAIGNPFGLDRTLSTGVISGLDREITSVNRRPITSVIQTDAAINPGNSGGPLLDSAGRLIGVNTAIYSPSGASAGVGFAVPVNTVVRVVDQLIQHGRVIQPDLNLRLDESGWGARLGIVGVPIIRVPEGSLGERAGLRGLSRDMTTGSVLLGDVIVALNGQTVEDMADIYRIMDSLKVGDQVTLRLRRGKKEMDVTINLVGISDEN